MKKNGAVDFLSRRMVWGVLIHCIGCMCMSCTSPALFVVDS